MNRTCFYKHDFCLILAIGMSLAMSPTALGQSGANEQGPVRLKAGLVQVDVVVTDKEGHRVTNFQKEEFELLENGKPQEISFFSFVDARRNGLPRSGEFRVKEEDASLSFAAGSNRLAVFVVDDLHLSTESFVRLRPALLNFLDSEVTEDDQLALVTTGGGLGMLQQLGRSKDVIRRAILHFSPKGNQQSISPFRQLDAYKSLQIVRESAGDDKDNAVLQLVVSEVIQEDLNGVDVGRMALEPLIKMAAQNIVDQIDVRNRQTLGTLANVIRDLEKLGSRKLIVLMSDGFFSVSPDLNTLQEARRVTDAATRAGAVIYTLDGRGLTAPVPGGDASTRGSSSVAETTLQLSSLEDSRRALRYLASETGGRALLDANAREGLTRIFDDNSVYYVLAYYPENTERDGKFRTIDVKVKGRNDLVIRTRKGYLALPPEELARPPLEKNEAVIKAISSPVPNPEARVSLATAFLYSPPADGSAAKGKATALISAHFDASWVTLKEEAGRQTGEVEVSGFVYDISGKLASGFSRTVKIQMRPRTQSLVEREGITYKDSVELPPGFYNLRLAVVDPQTLTVGTANDWIEIPDMEKSKVEIGGLLQPMASTAEAERAITKEASNNTERAAYQVLQREWERNSTADVVAIVYSRVSAKNLRSQVSLLKNNQVVVEQPERQVAPPTSPDQFRIPIGARIPFAGLPPGRYTLRVTVRGKNEKESATREILLTIQ